MYIYIHTSVYNVVNYRYTYIYTCIYIYINIIYIYMYMYISMYIYIYIFVYTHVCMFISVWVDKEVHRDHLSQKHLPNPQGHQAQPRRPYRNWPKKVAKNASIRRKWMALKKMPGFRIGKPQSLRASPKKTS